MVLRDQTEGLKGLLAGLTYEIADIKMLPIVKMYLLLNEETMPIY